jgi:hypothetical protein
LVLAAADAAGLALATADAAALAAGLLADGAGALLAGAADGAAPPPHAARASIIAALSGVAHLMKRMTKYSLSVGLRRQHTPEATLRALFASASIERGGAAEGAADPGAHHQPFDHAECQLGRDGQQRH